MHAPCTYPPRAEGEDEVALGEGFERDGARAALVALAQHELVLLALLELAQVHLHLGGVCLLVARLVRVRVRVRVSS